MLMNLNELVLDLNATISIALVAVFLILLYRWSFTAPSKNLPPSPPHLPIIGNLHQLGLHPHRSLEALSKVHGSLMLLRFGSVPVLVVSSAEAAREIMKTHDLSFSDRPNSVIFEKLLYNYKDVAFAPYGEYWRQLKSVCVLNLLSNTRVRSFRSVREEETKSMIDEMTQHASSSRVVNLSEMFSKLSNDIVCRVALGRKYGRTDYVGGGQTFIELLQEFSELLGIFSIGDFIPWLVWLNRINGLNAKLDKLARQFDKFLDRVIQEHRDERPRSGNDDHTQIVNENEKDFVDVLLEIQKENSLGFPLDIVSIKGLILDMFVAGTDTTHTLLEWEMAELIRHPSIMRKLQNEIRGIVGNKSQITENDLVDMHYLKAVIKETLRLHPPVPLLGPRKFTQDVKIMGRYDIKANTNVIVNAWKIGRDVKSYNNPEEYDPERFLRKHSHSSSGIDYKGNEIQFIPFGAGRRICPGIQFATAINEMALANLVHKFDWTLPGGAKCEDLDMSESTGLSVHRKNPLRVLAIPVLVESIYIRALFMVLYIRMNMSSI